MNDAPLDEARGRLWAVFYEVQAAIQTKGEPSVERLNMMQAVRELEEAIRAPLQSRLEAYETAVRAAVSHWQRPNGDCDWCFEGVGSGCTIDRLRELSESRHGESG